MTFSIAGSGKQMSVFYVPQKALRGGREGDISGMNN